MNQALRSELIARAERDQETLQSLKDAGELADDAYHPILKQLHAENTEWAKELCQTAGWPTISQVGDDGSDAMWLIVQHSVLDPDFMFSCVSTLERLVAMKEARGWHLAFLQDRALMLQGKPQVYGTQHVLNDQGELQPYDLTNPEEVDQKRESVGLEPLEARTRFLRADHERVKRARARHRALTIGPTTG